MLTSDPEKYLLALKCLEAARDIDPEDATLHEQSIRLRLARKYHAISQSALCLTCCSLQALRVSPRKRLKGRQRDIHSTGGRRGSQGLQQLLYAKASTERPTPTSRLQRPLHLRQRLESTE